MAQARAFKESSEYILPVRFDDTEIEGITATTGYIDLRELSAEDFASLLIEKIKSSVSEEISYKDLQTAFDELKAKTFTFEKLTVSDDLTGLLNRRYMAERLAEETNRYNQYGYPTSLMIIDVDDFKSYNDKFGHPEGDKALQTIAHALKKNLRGADVAARYGSEEFSVLLPQTTSAEAKVIAERMRRTVETSKFPNRQVTVSIGIANLSHVISTPDAIVKAADTAVYKAKKEGGNNVQVYGT